MELISFSKHICDFLFLHRFISTFFECLHSKPWISSRKNFPPLPFANLTSKHPVPYDNYITFSNMLVKQMIKLSNTWLLPLEKLCQSFSGHLVRVIPFSTQACVPLENLPQFRHFRPKTIFQKQFKNLLCTTLVPVWWSVNTRMC